MRFIRFTLIPILLTVTLLAISQRKSQKPQLSTDSKYREAEYYFTEGEKYFILEDYAKAIALFHKSIELDPDNATAYYKLSETELKNNETDKALKDGLRALELEKGNKYFYLLVIDIYTRKGDLESGSRVYEQMIETVPGTDSYLMELAALYLYQKKYKEALDVYEKMEQKFGFSDRISFQKFRIYTQIGNDKEALKELQNLVNNFPENEIYLITLAEFLKDHDKEEEAMALLTDFVEKNKANGQANILLGDLHRKKGDHTLASMYLKRAFENPDLDLNAKSQIILDYKNQLPNSTLEQLISVLCETLIQTHSEEANAYALYGDYLRETGKIEPSKDQYLKSLQFDPSNFSVWQNVLLIETQLNQFDSVVVHSESALELFPNQTILYYLSGYSLLRKKEYQEAAERLEYGKRMSTSDLKIVSDFNSLLGEAYNGLKAYEKSDKAYEAVLDHNPNDYNVLNNYSYYLSLRNEYLEKAERMSQRLINDNPDNPTYLDTHAWVLFKREKYKEAKKTMEKAISLGRASAIYFDHYGDILYKLGDVENAVLQWQKAKGLNSASELIDKKIADRKLYEN